MATFRPVQNTCELNFDDRVFYSLPLHEDTAYAIDKAMQKIIELSPKEKAGVDGVYNAALDALDEVLGEGAATSIMGLYDNPGILEVWNVLLYILCEWKGAYNAELERLKTAYTPGNKAAIVPNRTNYRARR